MTDVYKKEQFTIACSIIDRLPHAKALGLQLVDLDERSVTIVMPYHEKLIGDPVTRVVHGGAVSALMDTCCGTSVMMQTAAQKGTATLDLRIDYMRSATPGHAIKTRAECYHITRSVAFVRAVATDDDQDNPVAMAAGAFTI